MSFLSWKLYPRRKSSRIRAFWVSVISSVIFRYAFFAHIQFFFCSTKKINPVVFFPKGEITNHFKILGVSTRFFFSSVRKKPELSAYFSDGSSALADTQPISKHRFYNGIVGDFSWSYSHIKRPWNLHRLTLSTFKLCSELYFISIHKKLNFFLSIRI